MSISGTTSKPLRYASETDGARRRQLPRFTIATAALAVAAAVWAFAGSSWIFPQLSANSDEGIYLLQADTLASGHLAPPAPQADPDAYLPWFATVRDGAYVLKYTPVHAALLAAGDVAFGTTRLALVALAAAQVVLVVALARELGARRRAAVVAGALFLASPLVLQLSITYLAYGTSLALFLATATASLRAVRTQHRGIAVLAGFTWGLAAFARPYDAILGALAIVGAIAWRERSRLVAVGRIGAWAAAGAAVPMLALLAFNQAMSGDPFQLPFNLLEPRDGPGFGLRRALPSDLPLDYTPTRAASALGRNLLLVTAWTGGGLVACAFAIATFVRRRLPYGGVVAAVLVVWPIGYFFFWGSYMTAYVWDGALFLGPYYYLPMVAAIAIAASVTLVDLWDWRPAVAGVAALSLLLLSAGIAIPALADQRDRTSQRVAVADALDAAIDSDEEALVFVPPLYGPYLQNPFSFLRNHADLNGDIVYALDRDPDANARVQAAYSDRTAYRLVAKNAWSDQPGFVPDLEVVALPPP